MEARGGRVGIMALLVIALCICAHWSSFTAERQISRSLHHHRLLRGHSDDGTSAVITATPPIDTEQASTIRKRRGGEGGGVGQEQAGGGGGGGGAGVVPEVVVVVASAVGGEFSAGRRRMQGSRHPEHRNDEQPTTGPTFKQSAAIIVLCAIAGALLVCVGWCWVSSLFVCVSFCCCKLRYPPAPDDGGGGVKEGDGDGATVVRAAFCESLASVVCVADDYGVVVNDTSCCRGEDGNLPPQQSKLTTRRDNGGGSCEVLFSTNSTVYSSSSSSTSLAPRSSMFFRHPLTATVASVPTTPTTIFSDSDKNSAALESESDLLESGHPQLCEQQQQQRHRFCHGRVAANDNNRRMDDSSVSIHSTANIVNDAVIEEEKTNECETDHASATAPATATAAAAAAATAAAMPRLLKPRLLKRWFSTRFFFPSKPAARNDDNININNSSRFSNGRVSSEEELAVQGAGGLEEMGPVFSHRRRRVRVRDNGGNGDGVPPGCATGGDRSGQATLETREGVIATTTPSPAINSSSSAASTRPPEVSTAHGMVKSATMVQDDSNNCHSSNSTGSSTWSRVIRRSCSGVSNNKQTDVSHGNAALSTTTTTSLRSTHQLFPPSGTHDGQEECKHGAGMKRDGPAPTPGDKETASPVLPRARALWRAFSEVDHGEIEETHRRAAREHNARFYVAPTFANPPVCYVPYQG